MKILLCALALIGGLGLGGCGVASTGSDDGAAARPAAQVEGTSTVLSCGSGQHRSCYSGTGDCSCCPLNEVLDCFGPGDCYCCSGARGPNPCM